MRPGSGGFGKPTVRPDVPERFRCGDCESRGMTGLCLLRGVSEAPKVSARKRACSGFQCSMDAYERLTDGMLF